MKIDRERNAKKCENFIEENIIPGSTIYADPVVDILNYRNFDIFACCKS